MNIILLFITILFVFVNVFLYLYHDFYRFRKERKRVLRIKKKIRTLLNDKEHEHKIINKETVKNLREYLNS